MTEPTNPHADEPNSGPAGARGIRSPFSSLHRGKFLRPAASLRQRNFRLYASGQMISMMGTSMQSIGQAWLVLQLTHSALQIGVVGALQAVPVLLFSLLGGVIADRWPKRRILLATQPAAMVQALLLWMLLAGGVLQLWHLYVLALLLGLTNSVGRPASRAFIVELVGRQDLPNAVALYSSAGTLAVIVGPGLGGIIIAATGVPALFLFNAISFLPVIATLFLLRSGELHAQPGHPVPHPSHNTWRLLGEGVGFVRSTPAIGLVTVVVGLVLLFGSNFNVVLPLFATRVLHVGATGFGFLSAAAGAGALIATLWLAWGNRRPTIRSVLIGTIIFGILEVAFAMVPVYPLSLLFIAGVGFAESTFAAQAITALQVLTPDELRGRVMSVQVVFFDGSLPMGYLLMGWLSSLYGASVALTIGAILVIVVAGAGWAWRKPAERNAAELAHLQVG